MSSRSHHRDSRQHKDRSRQKDHRRDDDHHRRRKRSRSSSEDRYNSSRHQKHDRHHKDNRDRDRERDRDRDRDRQSRRSQSKDKDKQPRELKIHQNYPQKQQQQAQQKVRIAIRNNQIHFDAKLLEILRAMPMAKQQQLKSQGDSMQKIHECVLVRELFISGLQEMTDVFIREHMKQYGQIEKIQIIKNFAYVRYNKVCDASNACAEYHNINMRIHNMNNPNFKIFFADHVKRWNVVSNNPQFQVIQDLVPVMYCSIRNDPPFNTEPHLREVFSKFGHVRNIQVKIPIMKPYKTYVIVEYQTLVQALRARQKVKPYRERYLGDRKSQIAILLDSQKYSRQYPTVKNQLRIFHKRPTTSGPPLMQMNKTINPFLQHIQPQNQKNHMQMQMPMQMNGMPMSMNMQQMGSMQQMNNNQNKNSQQQSQQTDIFAMIRQFTQKQAQADLQQSEWTGFLTRNKQFKVQVDLSLIHKVPFQLDSILNVSHRGNLQQCNNREDYVMAGRIKAANKLNINAFNNYINYFVKKNRAGIIQTKNYLIYLLPPVEEVKIYEIKKDEMLALFYKL